MKKKDLLELKKRFRKEDCSFTRMTGCFVNTEKHVILKFEENFLNLDEEDFFKYLEIAKKVVSGKLANNILKLNFKEGEDFTDSKQSALVELKKSKLEDDEILDEFYNSIIENYELEENYLILFFHDVYDIMTKTNDNRTIDESEEVFEYIICAICPISLSAPGLSYYEDENAIKSRQRDWLVKPPINGFIYPGFVDRSPDIDSLIYYSKNPKLLHNELIEEVLSCISRDPSSIQMTKLQSIIEDSISADEDEGKKLYMEVQENLNTMLEDHKLAKGSDDESMELTKSILEEALDRSNLEEKDIEIVEKIYQDNFGKDLPVVENIIDKNALKNFELRKNEISLDRQVEFLKNKLETLEEKNEELKNYDIVLKIRENKADLITRQVIDGQEYLIVPIDNQDRLHTELVE